MHFRPFKVYILLIQINSRDLVRLSVRMDVKNLETLKAIMLRLSIKILETDPVEVC